MKKLVAFLFILVLSGNQFAMACTTFFLDKNGQKIFGKNYDWVTGTGVVHTNIKGLQKTSLPLDNGPIFNWISKYRSITFNQYGKEFPNGGMNEKGLVVELMWLDDSEYPKADKRPSISVLQWIQYQLDNCKTVEEVLATDKKLRVTSSGTPQHYLVADANGDVATIEFINGKMVVHTGKELPFPVLANDTYKTSLEAYSRKSAGRFTTACNMVQQYQKVNLKTPVVDYAFNILQKVSQGNFTKWNIVYDINNREIHFKTLASNQTKTIALKDFSLASGAKALSFDMNTSTSGNVSKSFTPFSSSKNETILKKAFTESSSRFTVPASLQQAMVKMAK